MTVQAGTWKSSRDRISVRLLVATDDPRDGVQVIRNSKFVPQKNSYYRLGNDYNQLYRCVDCNPTLDKDSKNIWDVECVWAKSDVQDREASEDGEIVQYDYGRTNTISIDWEDEIRPFVKDLDGKPVLNTAGQKFSRVPEERIPILIIKLQRQEYRNMWPISLQFRNVFNDAEYWNLQRGKVLCRSILFKTTVVQGYTNYFDCDYTFAVRPDGEENGTWEFEEIESTGFYEIAEEKKMEEDSEPNDDQEKEPNLRRIVNQKTGVPYDTEQYLNEKGVAIPPKEGLTPHVMKFKKRRELDFSRLGLPHLGNVVVDRFADIGGF